MMNSGHDPHFLPIWIFPLIPLVAMGVAVAILHARPLLQFVRKLFVVSDRHRPVP